MKGRLLQAAVGVFVVLFGWVLWASFPVLASHKIQVIRVYPNETLSSVSQNLQKNGIIESEFVFRLDSLFLGSPYVQPGFYRLPEHSNVTSVLSLLRSGPNVRALDVEPGMTLRQITLSLASQVSESFALAFRDQAAQLSIASPFRPRASLEGLLGTGLYALSSGITPRELLVQMQSKFLLHAASVGLTSRTSIHGLNAYQLVIAASIVEKEAFYAKNMPKVARVILNRLQRGGGLQMDATILYYLGLDGGRVTHTMLTLNTPYNTYKSAGLTPTPICVPSELAMQSILSPPKGTWLYFTLIDSSGTEAFSTTFAEQLINEKLAASRGIS